MKVLDQEADILEELQDPKFLQTLAQLRQGEIPKALDIEDDHEDLDEAGPEPVPKGRKRKRDPPVLLKDISHELVSSSLGYCMKGPKWQKRLNNGPK